MEKRNQSQQIHIRCDKGTREKWLAICNRSSSRTQSHLFKNMISSLFELLETTNIIGDGK